MQPKIWIALVVYLASYLPLSVILLVQDLRAGIWRQPFCKNWSPATCQWPLEHPARAVTMLVGCIICFAVVLGLLRIVEPKNEIVIKKSRHVPADLMNYTLPYIVAFMVLDFADTKKLLGFGVFFLWIFIITYKSGQIILNPVLTAFGWKLYEIDFMYLGGSETESSGTVLSKVYPAPGERFKQETIQDVMLIKG
ncbi:MAG TPA: hypothetical protein VG407_07015 [Caulobacteraceae bacterium]|jgi:hypothetical protein|nr:hypothetical protein [Caulobacteraceae bacterium]